MRTERAIDHANTWAKVRSLGKSFSLPWRWRSPPSGSSVAWWAYGNFDPPLSVRCPLSRLQYRTIRLGRCHPNSCAQMCKASSNPRHSPTRPHARAEERKGEERKGDIVLFARKPSRGARGCASFRRAEGVANKLVRLGNDDPAGLGFARHRCPG